MAELIRKVGISEETFYRWKSKYVGLEVDQVRQMKQLRDENTRLKQLVAETDAGQDHASGCAAKKVVKPSRRRPLVEYLREQGYRVSERHACRVLLVVRGTYRYQSHQRTMDGTADADAGDRTEPGALRIPQDPRAAEPRGLARWASIWCIGCTRKRAWR